MKFIFGRHVLDVPRRQLARETVSLHLTPKAFEFLHLLLAAAPRVVSKKELHERLWQGTFVSDSALLALVKEVRHVLREPGVTEEVVRTAHRIGYGIACEVQVTAPASEVTCWHWLVLRSRRIVLQPGENVVGRDPTAHVWLDVSDVSRRHARIVIDGARGSIEDLGSKNGTRVRDIPIIESVVLHDGDRLSIGGVDAVYRCSGAGLPTETSGAND
jgi:DNA-binding winged helix-turn-helix (wHTH) protein